MHDAVMLEQKGISTAVVVTDAFLNEARVQRKALGMEDLEPVVIKHPLSSLREEEIEQRARDMIPRIKQVLFISSPPRP
jgi:hypothetical protein